MNTSETQLEFDFMKPEQLTLDLNGIDQTMFLTASPSQSIFTIKPNYSVTFHLHDKQVGALDWNDGQMKFIGDADESAKMFFDKVIKMYFDLEKEILNRHKS